MNNSAINKELAHALRAILPFVPVGSPVRGAAVRALVDHDERVARERREQVEFINRVLNSWPARISGAEAMNQAARAVRPGEAYPQPNEWSVVRSSGSYTPAAPPAKGCNCDICTAARRRGIVEGWWKSEPL